MTAQNFKHAKGGSYLKDFVYGANDGIVTTFAVIAGVVGASLSPMTIILLGLANIFADGFSMAASSFLAARASKDMFHRERGVEKLEMKHQPELEIKEIQAILEQKGYYGDDLEKMTELIVKNEDFWADFMMYEELGLLPMEDGGPLRSAAATFAAFVAAGFLPIIPYLFYAASPNAFWWSASSAAAILFAVGALKTIFTSKNWFWSGLEMLLAGGLAGFISYGVGWLVKTAIV